MSEGVILTLTEESRMPELKSVLSVLDDESVLGPAQIKLALWLRERTFCTLYEAVKALLPAGPGEVADIRCQGAPHGGQQPHHLVAHGRAAPPGLDSGEGFLRRDREAQPPGFLIRDLPLAPSFSTRSSRRPTTPCAPPWTGGRPPAPCSTASPGVGRPWSISASCAE